MPLPSVTFPDIQSLSGIRACPLQQAWRRYQMTDTATNREGPYPGCVQRYNGSLSTQGSGDHKCTKALSFFQSSTRKLLGDLWGEVEKQLGVIRCRGNTGQAQRDRSPFLSTLKAQPQSLVLSVAYLLPKAEPAAAPVGAQEGNSVRPETWPP